MGSLDGDSPACPGCGGPDRRTCSCVGANALLGFLGDFSRATAAPPPEPARPHRRTAHRRGGEDGLAVDEFGQEVPPGADTPLPVWPPPPPHAPPPPPSITEGTGEQPARPERRGLLRRLRA